MQELLIDALGAFFYVSGFLLWPYCTWRWRKSRRRTRALRGVFFAELAAFLTLGGIALSGKVTFEHGYGWWALALLVNVLFTGLAIVAALWDWTRGESV